MLFSQSLLFDFECLPIEFQSPMVFAELITKKVSEFLKPYLISTVLQELMQEGFIYRTTVADSFQIIEPILQTIRSSCEIRAEVLIMNVRLELRIHKLDGSMMYLDLTDVLEALMGIDLNAKIQVSVACKRWCCKSILGLDYMNGRIFLDKFHKLGDLLAC
jgi:hypothetical protein